MPLGKVITLVRTNIVVDFPSRNGFIYRESALLDLVMMSGQVNGMGGKIIDKLPRGDKTFLIWLKGQQTFDFKVHGFELVNGELGVQIDFGDKEAPKNAVAHPFVTTTDVVNTNKIISKIDKLMGIVIIGGK